MSFVFPWNDSYTTMLFIDRPPCERADRLLRQASQVGGHDGRVEGHKLTACTTAIGHGVWCRQRRPTDPSNSPVKPPPPRAPTTSRSAPCALETSCWLG